MHATANLDHEVYSQKSVPISNNLVPFKAYLSKILTLTKLEHDVYTHNNRQTEQLQYPLLHMRVKGLTKSRAHRANTPCKCMHTAELVQMEA